jgi:TRAP-type mannitol/chloroaromatic compound transport system permease small subunit
MLRRFARRYVGFADTVNEKVGFGVSWLTALLVLVVCYDVFTRYLLRNSIVAVQELEWHLFAVIFLVGAAYTLKHNRHVRVDVFYTRFSERTRAWIDFTGSLIFLIPLCILAIWTSRMFVFTSYMIGETSPDPGGLPARFILKSAIPIGFFLLLLQGVALALGSLLKAVGDPVGSPVGDPVGDPAEDPAGSRAESSGASEEGQL